MSSGSGGPILECPGAVDLGSIPVDSMVDGVLVVSNAGGQPLLLTTIASDCGCMGVHILPGRTPVRPADTLTVPPVGSVCLALPFRPSGLHGQPNGHLIRFRTNDPARPAVEVPVRYIPLARYFAMPGRVSFGEVAAGNTSVTTFDVFASAGSPHRSVRHVLSTRPDRLRFNHSTDAPAAANTEAVAGARHVCQARAELIGEALGAVSGEAHVYLDGDTEPSIRVVIETLVVSRHELVPAVVYLPRSSSAGPLYSATVSCRSAGTSSVSVELGLAPVGISARVEDVPGDPSARRLVVECDPARFTGPADLPVTFKQANHEQTLVLRVVARPE